MVIDIGAKVITRDGKRVASVDRVVLDPRTGDVTHLVLHKGMFIVRDVVVPLAAVWKAESQIVHLNVTGAEVEGMPDFVETEYVVPQQASATGPYVPGTVLWPTAYAYAPVVERQERHVPEDAIDITEGTDVTVADGKIGVVDEVVVSEEDGEVIGFVLKRGVLGRRDGVVPVSWVERADSEEVRLNRSKKEVEDYFRSEDIRG